MPNPYQLFQTDTSKETEGIIIDYGDFRFTIARAGGANQKFRRALEVKLRPHRRRIDSGTMDSAVADRIAAECFAKHVVRGWEGVTDSEGNSLPFTQENCVKLLLDLSDLFMDLQEQATAVANFTYAVQEEDSKS